MTSGWVGGIYLFYCGLTCGWVGGIVCYIWIGCCCWLVFFFDYRSPPDPRPDANRTLDLTLTPTFPMYVWENESIFNWFAVYDGISIGRVGGNTTGNGHVRVGGRDCFVWYCFYDVQASAFFPYLDCLILLFTNRHIRAGGWDWLCWYAWLSVTDSVGGWEYVVMDVVGNVWRFSRDFLVDFTCIFVIFACFLLAFFGLFGIVFWCLWTDICGRAGGIYFVVFSVFFLELLTPWHPSTLTPSPQGVEIIQWFQLQLV